MKEKEKVARPERFELPTFWFVVEKSGNPKALQVSHLQAAPASKILPQLVHKLVHTRAGFMKRMTTWQPNSAIRHGQAPQSGCGCTTAV